MFSFRRRPRANSTTGAPLKTSPSLPELHAQGIPWPENLVDMSALRDTPSPPEQQPYQGAVKNSLHSHDHAPILFHKPFRFHSGQQTDAPNGNGPTISSLSPSSAGTITNRRTHRKNRTPPAFNLMVVGARGTGKTSLLRLLLDTAEISPNATEDQRAAWDRFLDGGLKPTASINTACVEICESRYDRVQLTVIDTPGLDFSPGQELSVERQVTSIIRYLDELYADTMNEESKVVRQSKGDQHVHLCIFMVDPSSIMSRNARHGKSSLPKKTVSETTISLSSPVAASAVDPPGEYPGDLVMSPAELRVIRRLSARVNVLPVIAKADSLTDDTLSAVKRAVHTGLEQAARCAWQSNGVNGTAKNTPNHVQQNGDSHAATDIEAAKDRASRPVITLKGTRMSRSRSRSRRDLSAVAQDEREPHYPDETDEENVANVRFSAKTVTKTSLDTLLPFALIAPEPSSSPRLRQSTPELKYPLPGEDNPGASVPETPVSPDSPILSRKSAILRGVFTRKFRWGTVDVLSPEHCDFAALRTAILLTHMKVLKVHTREVLYEKYRTEKLLAKRATRSYGPEETKRLFEDLGL
ncbi:Septin-domain-containing protein [Melanogaster broomeanus]|nr:Septin-domain-containing protein [Melanogaster broomeanus]